MASFFSNIRLLFAFCLCVALSSPFVHATSSSSSRPRRSPSCAKVRLTTAERCANPPVEKEVDLSAYTGRWHQIFTSGTATFQSGVNCVTANYTLTPDTPLRIAVLNCKQDPAVDPVPSCVRANATRRPDGVYPSQLLVQFFPDLPPGNYNIAALIGNPNYGYQAAAVYSCFRNPVTGQVRDGFFIIARSPYAPYFIARRVLDRLRCNGYDVDEKSLSGFVRTFNGRSCKYIGPPENSPFVVRPPGRPRPRGDMSM